MFRQATPAQSLRQRKYATLRCGAAKLGPKSVPISAHQWLTAHDADGNQTATSLGQVYVWDAENRLISVEPFLSGIGDKKVVNTYDAQSRRVRCAVFTYTGSGWSLTTDEKFIYDGWNVVAVLLWNPSTSTFDLMTWGLDLSGSLQDAGGVGGLLVAKDGSDIYHYTYDANGNVSEVLDDTGSIVAHYEYNTFGDTFVATGAYAAANKYRFSTKPQDSVSGFYYYGFRFYNPNTGRWLSRDPIQERGGLNLYGMISNEPVGRWDYLGLLDCCSRWTPRFKILRKSIEQCFNDRLYDIDPALHGRLKTGQFINEIAATAGLSGLGGAGMVQDAAKGSGTGLLGRAAGIGSLGYLLYDSSSAMRSVIRAYDWCNEEKCTRWADPVTVSRRRSAFNPVGWFAGRDYQCTECPASSEDITPVGDRNNHWRSAP